MRKKNKMRNNHSYKSNKSWEQKSKGYFKYN